jgi:glycosyltransferase involved in cell wall biosynthesis
MSEDGGGLRICLVLATSTGGVGRHVRALATGLHDAGHQVVVLAPAATRQRFGFASPGDGTEFAPVEIGSGLRPVADFRAAVQVSQLMRDADVVHAHGLRAGVVTALGLRKLESGRPAFVVTLHNAMTGSWLRRRVLSFVEARLARAADQILAVSPDLVVGLRRTRPDADRALVASSLRPPTTDRAETRAALGVDEGSALVLAIGRLHRQKGFDILVAAAGLLAGVAPATVFVIAGEGPMRGELETLIARSPGDVRLLGDRADISELANAADLVVMPSRWEGWSLAAAEVLGAGRPFIASAVGGLPELVRDGGILVASEDPDALADAIRRVLAQPSVATQLAATALARATELPAAHDVTASVLATYGRAIKSRMSR